MQKTEVINKIKNRTKSDSFWKRLSLMLALLLAVLAFVSCHEIRPENSRRFAFKDGITIEQVVLNPGDFIGKQVSIGGTVREKLGSGIFLIRGESAFDQVIAVGADPEPKGLTAVFSFFAPVKKVRLTGEVRRFDAAEIERQTGIKLKFEDLNRYAQIPLIVVKEMRETGT